MFTTSEHICVGGAAATEHIAQLQELWRIAFGDEDGYTALFFEHCYMPQNTFVALDAGRVVSALYALPLTLKCDDKELDAAYIYAVATLPGFRGLGLSTGLLGYAHGELAARGYAATLLVPAGPTLFDFYARQGYTPFGARAIFEGAAGFEPQDGGAAAVPLGSETELMAAATELFTLRERFLTREAGCYASWDVPALTYRLREHRYLGGELYRLPGGGYALTAQVGEGGSRRLIIRELGYGPEGAAAALRAVGAEAPLTAPLPPHTVLHAVPAGSLSTQPYAMLRMLGGVQPPKTENAFFGLALD